MPVGNAHDSHLVGLAGRVERVKVSRHDLCFRRESYGLAPPLYPSCPTHPIPSTLGPTAADEPAEPAVPRSSHFGLESLTTAGRRERRLEWCPATAHVNLNVR